MLDGRPLSAYRVIEAPGMQDDLVRWRFMKPLDRPVADLATEMCPDKRASQPAKRLWMLLGGVIAFSEKNTYKEQDKPELVAKDRLITGLYGCYGHFEIAAFTIQTYHLRKSLIDPRIIYNAKGVGCGFIENLGLTPKELRLLYLLREAQGDYVEKGRVRDRLDMSYNELNSVIYHFGKINRPDLNTTPRVALETRHGNGRYSSGARLVEV